MRKLVLAPTSLPHAGPLDVIEAAAAAGYDGLGLRLARSPNQPFQPVVGNKPLIRDIRVALSATGLSVLDIFSYWIEPAMDLDEFKATFEVAAQLRAKYILVLGNDPDPSRLAHNFAVLAEAAGAFGLACAIEFAINRPLSTLQQAAGLIASSRCDAAIVVDPMNLVRSGGNAQDLAQVDPSLLPYMHFCDGIFDAKADADSKTVRIASNRRCLPGDGILPLREILDGLPADITLSVEIPGPNDPQMSARDHARLIADASRRFLQSYDDTKTGQRA